MILVIGANPTDGHPVFASRMKKRLRAGARLIVADPRRIDLVKSPHIRAQHHLPLLPGTNVALLNALSHVIVTEGLVDQDYVRERCELGRVRELGALHRAGAQLAGGDRGQDRRAGRRRAGGGAAVRHRRQRRRSITGWA